MKNNFTKRVFDFTFATILIILCTPIFFVISIVIKVFSKGPILHWSKRIGKKNVIFEMPKFRTMHTDTPQLATHLMKNPQKNITRIGYYLRKTSLDELPQFWSIIVGDMSFVGPRPALFNQYDLKKMRTKKNIHILHPGITGWAQINGRDNINVNEKVKLDLYYLNNQSTILDFKIILFTLVIILKKKEVKH